MYTKREIRFNFQVILILFTLNILGSVVLNNIPISKLISLRSIFKLTFFISLLVIYFINYSYCVPKFLVTKKYLKYILCFIGLSVLFSIVRFVLEEVIVFNLIGKHNYYYDSIDAKLMKAHLFDSFYYTLLACLASGVVFLIFRFNEHKEKVYLLELENKEAQIKTLKSQISPHFLFNTLNNFYVELIEDKPETAGDILKLSNLLRYVTYESSNDFALLEKEITFLKDYLHFYKRRYEDNLHIYLTINGEVKKQKIPTLILIHFVENMCKHGIINDIERSASITINIHKDALEIFTKNHINASEKYMEVGIGKENIKKRLDVLFKDRYYLHDKENNNIFETHLKIPLS